jgi:hypothetical protein
MKRNHSGGKSSTGLSNFSSPQLGTEGIWIQYNTIFI